MVKKEGAVTYDVAELVNNFWKDEKGTERLSSKEIAIFLAFTSYKNLIKLLKEKSNLRYYVIKVLEDTGITQEDADELIRDYGSNFEMDIIKVILHFASTNEITDYFIAHYEDLSKNSIYLIEIATRIVNASLFEVGCLNKLKENESIFMDVMIYLLNVYNCSNEIDSINKKLLLSRNDYKKFLNYSNFNIRKFAIKYANVKDVLQLAMKENVFVEEVINRLKSANLNEIHYIKLFKAQNHEIREYAIRVVSNLDELTKIALIETDQTVQLVIIKRFLEILERVPKEYCENFLKAKGNCIKRYAILHVDLEVVFRLAITNKINDADAIKQRIKMEKLKSGYYNRLLKSKDGDIVAFAVMSANIDKVIELSMKNITDEKVIWAIVERFELELTKEQANKLLKSVNYQIREIAAKYACIDEIVKYIKKETCLFVKNVITCRLKMEFHKISTKLGKMKALQLFLVELDAIELKKFIFDTCTCDEDRELIKKAIYNMVQSTIENKFKEVV